MVAGSHVINWCLAAGRLETKPKCDDPGKTRLEPKVTLEITLSESQSVNTKFIQTNPVA